MPKKKPARKAKGATPAPGSVLLAALGPSSPPKPPSQSERPIDPNWRAQRKKIIAASFAIFFRTKEGSTAANAYSVAAKLRAYRRKKAAKDLDGAQEELNIAAALAEKTVGTCIREGKLDEFETILRIINKREPPKRRQNSVWLVGFVLEDFLANHMRMPTRQEAWEAVCALRDKPVSATKAALPKVTMSAFSNALAQLGITLVRSKSGPKRRSQI